MGAQAAPRLLDVEVVQVKNRELFDAELNLTNTNVMTVVISATLQSVGWRMAMI
jgi:hypothetical protein